MTEPVARPHVDSYEAPPSPPLEEPPSVPVDTPLAVQQLRAAGFSADQQATLTTALLRVLALWTQQATRDDLQTALHASEQRLEQQLDALREEMHSELVQHVDALRKEIRDEFTRQGDHMHTTPAAPSRRMDVFKWLIPALLVLTCAGGLLLVAQRVLEW